MNISAEQISRLLGGEIEGNPEVKVSRLSKIEQGEPGTLSFLANPAYTPFIYSCKASIVIVNKDFVAAQPVSATLIRVANAYESFTKLLELYQQTQPVKKGIEDPCYITMNAKMGKDVYVGAFVYVGANVRIGDNVKLYPNVYIGDNVEIKESTVVFAGVKIYNDCRIGAHCTIHAGVVIGGDGFGFTPNRENVYHKVPQTGNVVIEDHVEIGANTTIDRATLGSTVIGKGVKLDNLIQIAHNVEIGENTVIAAQTGIAGSTKIGKNCMIGGQVGIAGHLTIADGVKIGAQSGVGGNVKEGTMLFGSPAFGLGDFKKSYVYFKRLPDLEKRIRELELMVAVGK